MLFVCRYSAEYRLQTVGRGLDESRMVEKGAELVDVRRVRTGGSARVGNVVEVLPAARVRRISRRDISEGPPDSGGSHGLQRLRQKRVPVAIAPVNRQVDVVLRKFSPHGRNEFAHLRVDGTDAIEMFVVRRHFEQPLARDISSPEHILQKRNDVFTLFGAAEADDENRVVRDGHAQSVCSNLEA